MILYNSVNDKEKEFFCEWMYTYLKQIPQYKIHFIALQNLAFPENSRQSLAICHMKSKHNIMKNSLGE